MTKLEKAIHMETEGLEERIVKRKCPHNYGMIDSATSGDFICDGNCEKCWNKEIEGDSGATTEP